jgi:hypothetical protein
MVSCQEIMHAITLGSFPLHLAVCDMSKQECESLARLQYMAVSRAIVLRTQTAEKVGARSAICSLQKSSKQKARARVSDGK